MATAGYDPRAALDLWELMKCVEDDAVSLGKSVNAENKFGFLRTHPTSDERRSALEKDMPGAMRLWKDHLPERVRVKMRDAEQGKEADEGVKLVKGSKDQKEEAEGVRDSRPAPPQLAKGHEGVSGDESSAARSAIQAAEGRQV